MSEPQHGGPTSWSAALDALEASVITTEELLRSRQGITEPEPWAPPASLGALPSDLVPRARDLAERQQSILRELPALVDATQRQRDLTRRIHDATATRHGSIYIDTTA